MQRNGKLLAICLLMIPMLTLVVIAPPAASKSTPMIVQPTMPWSQPNVYEMYGPRLNNIHYVFTGSPEESFLRLDVGDVDIIDWACSKPWKDEWEKPTRTDIKVMGYGGEYGFYLLDVRCDPSKPIAPPFSTQSYTLFGDATLVDITLDGEDPYTTTRAAAARRAMAHMIDRTYIVSTVMGGLGEPIYIPGPAAHGGFNSPYVAKYYQDFDKARELLDDAGVVDNDADGWRDIPGTTEELVLDFMIRLGIPRELAGGQIAADIEAELAIHVNRQYGGSDISFPSVMVNREMDMYTGGWIHVTFPDHYLDLYSSEGWWPSGSFAPNYMKYCGPYSATEHFDPEVESCMDSILSSLDVDEVRDAVWTVQEEMMKKENVYTIPLVSTAAPKAWRTYMKGTAPEPGNEWKGIVNQTGQGVNNWWTFLNARTDNMPDPSYGGTITYGLSYVEVDFLNPIYAGWYQTWEILDKIYDSLLYLCPIDMATLRPWVARDFIHTKEYDIVQGEEVSVLYFTLRKDVYWQDGEQLNADDVIFTMTTLPTTLADRGLPPPWWDSNVRDINRIVKTDDFHIKVYYEYPTYFAPVNVGGNIILPEHIWNDIVTTGDPEAFAPDPTLTGSGPYQMDSSDYTAGVSADVYAYTPTSEGYFQLFAIHVFITEAEAAEDLPNTNTYWVGESYVTQVMILCDLWNLRIDPPWPEDVTATLRDETNNKLVGQTTELVFPAPLFKGVRFSYPLTEKKMYDRIPVVGSLKFKLTGTWDPPPPGGSDADVSSIIFKVTCDGDVISTGDPAKGVDGHVNLYDAQTVIKCWGSIGPYRYPPADINWDGKVNFLDALKIVTNYGKKGF